MLGSLSNIQSFMGSRKASRDSHTPHLITELCKNKGVQWIVKEEDRAPKGIINDGVVIKI